MTTDRERIQILCALVARAERLGEVVVITAEDLEAAESLDLEVTRYDGGDGPRIRIHRREDPRRAKIARALASSFTHHHGDALSEAIDRILEELDR